MLDRYPGLEYTASCFVVPLATRGSGGLFVHCGLARFLRVRSWYYHLVFSVCLYPGQCIRRCCDYARAVVVSAPLQ